jgi:serine/threonine-protein kinase
MGLLGMCLGGLIFAQYRRAIEGKDLPILAILTLLIVLIPALRGEFPLAMVVIVAVLGGAGAIAITALFRLIYQILSRFL